MLPIDTLGYQAEEREMDLELPNTEPFRPYNSNAYAHTGFYHDTGTNNQQRIYRY